MRKASFEASILWLLTVSGALGATRSVPGDYATIQAAIQASNAGDAIVVSPGTYYENIGFKGKAIVLRSTDPNDAKIVAKTVIDGKGSGSVVTFTGDESSKCVLDGFTITGGSGECGGGISGDDTEATIRNCIMSNNDADGDGGGICQCNGSIINCTITRNSARGRGGGVAGCHGGLIKNCKITHNWSGGRGGGLNDCESLIRNCTITHNWAGGRGGGMHLCDGPITGCTVMYNSAPCGGGLADCGPLTKCTITHNSAAWGGGVMGYNAGPIRDCVISDNTNAAMEDSGPKLIKGVRGQAYYFDGKGYHIHVGHVIGELQRFTVAMFVKYDSRMDAPKALFCNHDWENGDVHLHVRRDGKVELCINSADPEAAYSGTALEPGRWYHVAVTYEYIWDYDNPRGITRFYIDGRLDNEVKYSRESWAKIGPMRIGGGCARASAYYWWHGALDEVCIFDRALSADEIQSLSKNPESLSTDKEGLLGYWNFDSDKGQVVRDVGPNHYDARVDIEQDAAEKLTWVRKNAERGE